MSTKSTSPRPLVKLASVGILTIGFFYLNEGLQTLSQRINDLPVEGKAAEPEVVDTAVATGPVSRSMHPLLVESNQKAAALRRDSSAAPTNLDALFGRDAAQKELDEKKRKELEAEKAQQAAKVPPGVPGSGISPAAPGTPLVPAVLAIDYFKALAQRVRIQAVMPDGAVINGGFYSVGDEVKTLGYLAADGKKMLYPSLESVDGETVLLSEAQAGKRKIKAKLAV